MEKLKMGLVGCGGMMKSHVSAVPLLKDIEIVAVCDVVRSRAEDVATILNDPFVTTDYHEMVDMVDCVLIALPHDLHYECGMFFAKKGKHVLMEKPLCNSEEECLSLIETCEERGLTLMCAYPVPFWPAIQKLKALVDSGDYGKIMQSQFEKKTIRSEHIYQIFSYVKNYDMTNSGNVSGMLLYAKTEEDVLPDLNIKIDNNRIMARTLDLNQRFEFISKQLDDIAEMFFP